MVPESLLVKVTVAQLGFDAEVKLNTVIAEFGLLVSLHKELEVKS